MISLKIKLSIFFAILVILQPVHAQTNTIRVWLIGAEAEAFPKIARRFELENPDIKIRMQAFSWGGLYEKLVTAFLGGTPPDVCQIGTTMMTDFHAMGALENLDSLFKPGRMKIEDFHSDSISTCQFQNGIFGVPWYADVRVIYYRKEYLQRFGLTDFPDTWESFFEFGQRVMREKKDAGLENSYFASFQGFSFEMFYWQAGGKNRPLAIGVPAFEEQPLVEAVRFERNMKRAGFGGNSFDSGLDYITEFDQGRYEVAVSGPWMAAHLEENRHRMKSQWAMAVLPKGKKRTSFIGGSNLVQFKESKNKESGHRLILFLSRPDIQAEWYRLTHDLPANKSAMETTYFKDDPAMKVFKEQLADTRLPPPEKEWGIFWDRFHRQYQAFLEGNEDEAVLAKKMNNLMDQILRETRAARLPQSGYLYWFFAVLFPGFLVGVYLSGFKTQADKPVHKNHFSKSFKVALLFLAPALLIMLVFRFLPLCLAFATSFTNLGAATINNPSQALFSGLQNYSRLLHDEVFLKSVKNTLLYLLIGVPANLLIALSLALIINRLNGWKRNLLTLALFMPSIITTVASAVTWRWIYSQQSPVNMLINWLGFGPVNWLGDPDLALLSLIIFSVWRSYGLSMIIILAALELINKELYESVRIDGGAFWHEFRHVTLPGLARTLFAIFVGATVANIQFFIEPYMMTGGGPKDATLSILLFSYNRAFASFELGYASSVITVLFVFFIIFNIWQKTIRQKLS